MPRKKAQAAGSTTDLATALSSANLHQENDGAAETEKLIATLRARSFKPTLTVNEKGVTVGVRDGHDWVLSFPADPGPAVKARLNAAGFAYRNRKWKVF